MAQKLNDLAGKLGKGGAPPGVGLGLKVLGALGAAAYGVSQSMYTGKIIIISLQRVVPRSCYFNITSLLCDYMGLQQPPHRYNISD